MIPVQRHRVYSVSGIPSRRCRLGLAEFQRFSVVPAVLEWSGLHLFAYGFSCAFQSTIANSQSSIIYQGYDSFLMISKSLTTPRSRFFALASFTSKPANCSQVRGTFIL